MNKGAAFDAVYDDPKVLVAVHYILKQEFKLSSLNAVEAVPDHGFETLREDATSTAFGYSMISVKKTGPFE